MLYVLYEDEAKDPKEPKTNKQTNNNNNNNNNKTLASFAMTVDLLIGHQWVRIIIQGRGHATNTDIKMLKCYFLELTCALQVFTACLLVQDCLLGATSDCSHCWTLARFY
jgi:hypothetical protein